MYRFDAEKTVPRGDHVLIASIFLLTGLGLVTLYSSTYTYAQVFYDNGLFFIARQLKFGLAGIILFFIASRVNLEIVRKLIKPLVILALLLCIMTFIPGIRVVRNGASRWIHLGPFFYQPSELVKLALPLYLAHIFDKKQDRIDDFRTGILPPVLVSVLFFGLIYYQNNFSTAVFIALNALVIFFLAGTKLRFFFAATMMFLPLSVLLLLSKEHRVRRLISFIRPDWEPQGAGYQVRNSLLTISSGGFLGKGIGQGTRKNSSVLYVYSDFIFSAFAEESGFLGVLLFTLLFAVFAFLGFRAAMKADTVFKRLLAASLVTMIISQVMANIAVVSGSLPATGIPLPFFSAGGSSLATTLVCAGLIVNISRPEGNLNIVENQYVG
jgi:cell division protein FtsW